MVRYRTPKFEWMHYDKQETPTTFLNLGLLPDSAVG